MKQLLLFSILLFGSLITGTRSFAQASFDVPDNAEMKNKEDFAKYETTVADAAKWLEQTDLDKETDKRKRINSFVIQWISGSPTVSVDITSNLSKIYGNNTELLAIYLASYAKNMIEGKGSGTKATATRAGIVSMRNVYKKGINISKSKEMDKLIKMTDAELDEYVADKFK